MYLIDTIQTVRQFRKDHQNATLALIPTMGALHDGHLSLITTAKKHADIVLPYIFVNPTQFAPHEDLDSYPRTLEADIEKLSSLGVDYVYAPTTREVYPDGFQTTVTISDISQPLEGTFRPHFFNGVCTVVCKMLLQVMPDIAIFGEKDFQQLRVIQRMVADLNIPTQIIGAPTIRDQHGLALSSRNQYLSGAEYDIAIHLNKILHDFAAQQIDEPTATQALLDTGFSKVDYCTAVNSTTFTADNPDRVLAAACVGKTRLIDNRPIPV